MIGAILGPQILVFKMELRWPLSGRMKDVRAFQNSGIISERVPLSDSPVNANCCSVHLWHLGWVGNSGRLLERYSVGGSEFMSNHGYENTY